jgi:hypothetical protein
MATSGKIRWSSRRSWLTVAWAMVGVIMMYKMVNFKY